MPPLVDRGGRLVWSENEKASLFSGHLDAKRCRNNFYKPHSCDPSPVLCIVAFRSSFVRSLLLDLNPYGGKDSEGMFPLHTSRWLGSWDLS